MQALELVVILAMVDRAQQGWRNFAVASLRARRERQASITSILRAGTNVRVRSRFELADGDQWSPHSGAAIVRGWDEQYALAGGGSTARLPTTAD